MLFKPRPQSNTLSKARRPFGDPVSPIKPNPAFKAIPADHVQPTDLSYDVANVLTPDQLQAIQQAGKIVFHSVGDTGGINGTDIQDELAGQMEEQIKNAAADSVPAFFFHLGDVVYYNGISSDYK